MKRPFSDRAMTDRGLMMRFQGSGASGDFEALVRRWDAPIYSFLLKACRDREAAKDLRQEVFIRLYRYGGTYKPEHLFSTWLFQVASNVLSTWYAKESRGLRVWPLEEQGQHLSLHDTRPGPRELATFDELNERIEEALNDFTLVDRQLLLLRLDLEMNYREISEVMGSPETTVKSRFYVLVKRLREKMCEPESAKLRERRCSP